ncbi:HRH1-like protein [Mya arenaria]|uniref:HRH1-like protein n=2 Tax=Mya arenaria TaxID=6604 RepID=A0ABY7F477_MYAAR|nr:HRH1-like protein [Mya arenaria]
MTDVYTKCKRFVATMANNSSFMTSTEILYDLNMAEMIRLIPTAIFLGLVSAFGIAGNGIVMHVYRKQYKLSNAKVFIMCVAGIDMFSCCFAIPLEVILLLNQYTFQRVWMCKFSRFFNTFGTCSSSFILLIIAIDRHRKVCKPLKWQIKPKQARYLCFLGAFLGLLVSWPAIFVYGRKTFEIVHELYSKPLIGSECSTADAMTDSKIPFYYTFMFSGMFIVGIISMSTLYCLIGYRIRTQARKMSMMTSRSLSIPMTSSICENNDNYKVLGSINPLNITKRDLIQQKNDSTKRSIKEQPKPLSDVSWSERKDLELSYTSYNEDENEEQQPKSDNDDTADDDQDNSKTEENMHDFTNEINVNTVDVPFENNNTDDENIDSDGHVGKKIVASTTTNDLMRGKLTSGLMKRASSAGSQISIVLRRLTTFGGQSDKTQSLRKSQCLKEVRARKTAFIMFMISLVYILSYLPHLIVMATRAVKSDFVDNLTDEARAVYKFFLRSYFFNCAINPLIYGICDTRFRNACSAFFNKPFCKRK